ncbi:MAG: hypothetical protein JSW27_14900 [Phycisphaerales bacterium]|nr:MAG: hypothetical protein JSW27_14900 [Phycisphaerales bacterium]
MRTGKRHALIVLASFCALTYAVEAAPTNGPLRRCSDNPRYFADRDGKAILLTGSHVWYNLVDMGPQDPPQPFDYTAYLDWMIRYNHNFMRMWAWEMVQWDTRGNSPNNRNEITTFYVQPHPWLRNGPGNALDGKPKFDLTRFNPQYFDRLKTRVTAARDRGIYVAIMLFEGWAMQHVEDGWKLHPFHPANNVNDVNDDVNGDGKGLEVHQLVNEKVTQIQKAYIRKVIETVNALDNVLYEISNENHPDSTAWQYAMIDYIRQCEKDMPFQHPVGMTFQYKGGANQTLFDSPADWISPNPEGGYRDNPPGGDGRKVIVSDTDHLWGIGGNEIWLWKSVTRGLNAIFMDPYDGVVLGRRFDPKFETLRRDMGLALHLSRWMNLNRCRPLGDLANTGYCLADPGKEYLVFQPSTGQPVTLKLQAGKYNVEWFAPGNGQAVAKDTMEVSGGEKTLPCPVDGAAALYLRSTELD